MMDELFISGIALVEFERKLNGGCDEDVDIGA